MVGKKIQTKQCGLQWVNESSSTGEIVSSHATRQEARLVGQMIALQEFADHLVLDQDGLVQEKTAYHRLPSLHPPIG